MHKQVENEKNENDKLFILSVLNTRFRSVLKRFGINLQGGEIMYKGMETDWARLKDKWDVISAIRQEVPVDDDYIYEEFPVPKPDDYEAMREEMNAEKRIMFGMEASGADGMQKNRTESLIGRLASFFRKGSFERSEWKCPHQPGVG